MPQLVSRLDEQNWLTPSIADILDQGAAPPGGDGSMRELVVQLQDEFASLETPAKVVNVRPSPSYTLFVLQPEVVGRLGSRRTITAQELRRSVGQIAERHKDWRLGFMAQVEDSAEHVGLLVRTDRHRPLSLRRLLIRGTFRDYPSALAFTLGNTLEQKLIVRDLEETPHLWVVGEGSARQHLMSSLLLTFILFNTPAELRLILVGRGTEAYKDLANLPHTPGGRINSADDLEKVLTGLMTETQSRLDRFYEEGVNQLKAYNTRLRDQGKPTLPRIVVALDPLTDEAFQPTLERIIPLVRDVLVNGSQVGIHVIAAVNQPNELPSALDGLLHTQMIMRSSAGAEFGDKVKNWHASLMRFVDAFILERDGSEIIPVELCAIGQNEVLEAVKYWQGMVAQRTQNPLPDRERGLEATPLAAAPSRAQLQQQATMLAAYLGWLSVGVLHDIFGLSDDEAKRVIKSLQTNGIIEDSDSPMLRFIRLAEHPQ